MKVNYLKKISRIWIWAMLFGIAFAGCQKYNHIDNGGTVKVPYTLYIGGFHGTMHKTNDGLYYNTLFHTDNAIVRQVMIADSVVCNLKRNFYFSDDDGKYFELSNNHCIDPIDSFNNYFYPNNAIYDFTTGNVYLTTRLGMEFSTNLGRTFAPMNSWAAGTNLPAATDTMTSLTQLRNGICYAMIDSTKQYKKDPGGQWSSVTQDGTADLPRDNQPAQWYVSHAGDTLFAIDHKGAFGVYYSLDVGTTWTACSGNPKSKRILFGNQAVGNGYFYIGYDSAGLYRLTGTTFAKVGTGIPWYAKVGYVEGKDITYRTGVTKNYLYASTNVGLYWSKDGGLNWELVKIGSFSTLK
jgi:hypothetical protein